MSDNHEAECSLSEPCGLGAVEHDCSYATDFCTMCERSCTCRPLRAHGSRILKEWVESGIGSGRDAWCSVAQLQLYVQTNEEQAEQRGFDAGYVAGIEAAIRTVEWLPAEVTRMTERGVYRSTVVEKLRTMLPEAGQ